MSYHVQQNCQVEFSIPISIDDFTRLMWQAQYLLNYSLLQRVLLLMFTLRIHDNPTNQLLNHLQFHDLSMLYSILKFVHIVVN